MKFEDLVKISFETLVIIMIIAILLIVSDINSKISNVQNNCIIAKNETYCKVGGDK